MPACLAAMLECITLLKGNKRKGDWIVFVLMCCCYSDVPSMLAGKSGAGLRLDIVGVENR